MSKKKQDKTKLPEKDAKVELTEDELGKVSGGISRTISVDKKLGARMETKLGIRSGITGFKVEIDS